MLFMILREGHEKSDSAAQPTTQVARVNRLIHEMLGADVLVAADALQPTSVGARVRLADGERLVTEGPFGEALETIDAFALIRVDSKAEAIEWSARFAEAHSSRVEVREVAGISKFPPLVDLPAMNERMSASAQTKPK